MSHKNSERVTVECAGCHRTQTLRKCRLQVCDFYICGFGSCVVNHDFKIRKAEDEIASISMNAAGGFSGVTITKANEEHLAAVSRAKEILARGLLQLKTKGQDSKNN